jgi:hypothetical protein
MKLAYEEIVDFLASAPTPRRILNHKASPRVKARVAELVERKKNATLTTEEEDELANYLQLEHIMRMAKAKAALRLKRGK